jgi:hypothetical protein
MSLDESILDGAATMETIFSPAARMAIERLMRLHEDD